MKGDPDYEAWVHSDIGPRATAIRVARIRAAERRRKREFERRWHTIYKLYNAKGTLLYVGISANGLGRLPSHANDKAWWRKVARAELEHLKGRKAAEAREFELIRTLAPLHNVAGQLSPRPVR